MCAKITNKQFEPIWNDDEEIKKTSKKKLPTKKVKDDIVKKEKIDVESEVKYENKIEINNTNKILSMRDILNKYIQENLHFKLYYNNKLLYDTKVSNIERPRLEIDFFTLYETKYYYKGIKIQKY